MGVSPYHCVNCDYNLQGSPSRGRCPECGSGYNKITAVGVAYPKVKFDQTYTQLLRGLHVLMKIISWLALGAAILLYYMVYGPERSMTTGAIVGGLLLLSWFARDDPMLPLSHPARRAERSGHGFAARLADRIAREESRAMRIARRTVAWSMFVLLLLWGVWLHAEYRGIDQTMAILIAVVVVGVMAVIAGIVTGPTRAAAMANSRRLHRVAIRR